MPANIDKMQPRNGRTLCEDGASYNFGDHFRDEYTSIARGLSPNKQLFAAYGERTSSGAETNRIIWPNGVFRLPAASGVQMSLQSTSANDTAAGSNIRSVEIHYLDASLEPQTEVVTLNGTSPVLTTATNIRFIQNMHVKTIGTIAAAAGDITATNGGNTYSQIATGAVNSASSARMVPANSRLYMMGAVASSISGTSASRSEIRIVSSDYDNELYNEPLILFPLASIGVQDNAIGNTFYGALNFQAGAVVALSHTSNKAATLSGSWFGWIESV